MEADFADIFDERRNDDGILRDNGTADGYVGKDARELMRFPGAGSASFFSNYGVAEGSSMNGRTRMMIWIARTDDYRFLSMDIAAKKGGVEAFLRRLIADLLGGTLTIFNRCLHSTGTLYTADGGAFSSVWFAKTRMTDFYVDVRSDFHSSARW